MTERLYYTDPPVQSFDATVLACEDHDGGFHIVLDRTAFYPTSGGQPFDTGRLGGSIVVDVIDGDHDDVVHVVAGAMPVGARVVGEIDWMRRLDHTQQHTGQHLLSAAFDRLFKVSTVGFHMGADASTIDLAREVNPDEIDAAEAEANRVVFENRLVTIRFVPAAEASELGLRKASARTGTLRVIEVEDFDVSACGGTHVSRTGSIGAIAVSGAERVKGGTRLSFLCGGRVMRSHRALRDVVAGLSRALSAGPAELLATVERLRQEAKAVDKALQAVQHELAGYRADAIAKTVEAIGRHAVVLRVEPALDGPALKQLASAVVEGRSLLAVVVGSGAPAPVVVARSSDVVFDAAALLRALAGDLGGRGGGKADFAQGGISAMPTDVLDAVRRLLSERFS